jgi:hypothetical protein
MIWRSVAAGSSKRVGSSPSAITGKVEAGTAGHDLHLAVGGAELDLATLGQFADDVEEGVGRHGGRAGGGDVGRHRFIDLQVEIGRHQPQRAVLARIHQDVGQDGNGVAALHHRLDVAEALEEGGPFDRRLHLRCSVLFAPGPLASAR